MSPPEVSVTAQPLRPSSKAEVVALPLVPGGALGGASGDDTPLVGPGAEALLDAWGIDPFAAIEHARVTGAPGDVVHIPTEQRLILLIGVGAASPTDLRRAGATLARAVRDRDAVTTTISALADAAGLEAFVVGVTLGSFEFHWRSSGPSFQPVRRVVLAAAGDPDAKAAVARGVVLARAGWTSRLLATTPSNLKSPQWLADQAVAVASDPQRRLKATVWDDAQLVRRGFGGLVAVGRASATPPRLVRLDYAPAPKTGKSGSSGAKLPHIVLVGKGITFDTGGLSIKPSDAMATMKRDMTGAAVVIAVMGALQALGCAVKVTGFLAIAENAIGGAAMRPGDVIRHYGGRTSEVTNTDAEGRLVLADVLAYAVEQIAPSTIVDIATLTGAAKVALGLGTGAMFANDAELAQVLLDSATASGEPLHSLPLDAAYEPLLASKVADANNAAGGPGAITAALFLKPFVGDTSWAHLDIAPVGDTVAESFEWTTGPSGFGARLLLDWLRGDNPCWG